MISTPMPLSQGYLAVGMTGKRIQVDTWSFQTPSHYEARGLGEKKPLIASVKMVVGGANYPLCFVATFENIPDSPEFESTDIMVLKSLVEQYLDEKTKAIEGIEWENWLEVVVSGASRSQQGSLSVSFSTIPKGIKDGVAYTTGSGASHKPFPSPKLAGVEDTDMVEDSRAFGKKNAMVPSRALDSGYSYVPDTQENRLALTKIIQGMKQLQYNLAHVLDQDSAPAFLSGYLNQSSLAAITDATSAYPDVAPST